MHRLKASNCRFHEPNIEIYRNKQKHFPNNGEGEEKIIRTEIQSEKVFSRQEWGATRWQCTFYLRLVVLFVRYLAANNAKRPIEHRKVHLDPASSNGKQWLVETHRFPLQSLDMTLFLDTALVKLSVQSWKMAARSWLKKKFCKLQKQSQMRCEVHLQGRITRIDNDGKVPPTKGDWDKQQRMVVAHSYIEVVIVTVAVWFTLYLVY